MPLTTLNLGGSQVRDLTPLQGMPLTTLLLVGCTQLQDLTPVEGMKLTEIYLTPKQITRGMEALRRMPSLKTIGTGYEANERFPPEAFWKKYDAREFNK